MDYFYCGDGEFDAYLFHEGTFYKSHEFLGAHPIKNEVRDAVRFSVWAPNAKSVYLIGDFNDWNEESLPLKRIEETGLFSISVYDIDEFDTYKYRIITAEDEVRIKSDPYAFHSEERPKTASKYYNIRDYSWNDEKWMENREAINSLDQPMAIYEVNMISWRKKDNGDLLSYSELAKELVSYVKKWALIM